MSYLGAFGVFFLVLILRLRTRRKFVLCPAKTSVDLPWEVVQWQLTSVPVMSRRRSLVEPGASPTLTPATGEVIGTPASNNARLEPQADAIDDEPFELVTSHVIRIVYGKSFRCGNTGNIAFSARFPWPIAAQLEIVRIQLTIAR